MRPPVEADTMDLGCVEVDLVLSALFWISILCAFATIFD